jgi:hypothetical protein
LGSTTSRTWSNTWTPKAANPRASWCERPGRGFNSFYLLCTAQ